MIIEKDCCVELVQKMYDRKTKEWVHISIDNHIGSFGSMFDYAVENYFTSSFYSQFHSFVEANFPFMTDKEFAYTYISELGFGGIDFYLNIDKFKYVRFVFLSKD